MPHELATLCSHGHYDMVVQLFEQRRAALIDNAEVDYIVGFAYRRIHQPTQSKLLLRRALALGFKGYPGWASTIDLLAAIKSLDRLSPPVLESLPHVTVFSRDTPWMRPVIKALPGFSDRARELFGDSLPETDFYFFEKRDDFNRFFKLMFQKDITRDWQNGTGNLHIVTFCEKDHNGRPMDFGTKRTLGDILHEYGHSICASLYGSNYLFDVPEWLNEGMADAVAEPLYEDVRNQYQSNLTRASASTSPPSYQQLCKELYVDPQVRYAFGNFMVRDMIEHHGQTVLRKLMSEAVKSRNFEQAIIAATGENGPAFYERVRQRFWHDRVPGGG